MKTIILSKEQIRSFVAANYKPIGGEVKLTGENRTILFKTAHAYGFEVDEKKTEEIFGSVDRPVIKEQEQRYGAVLQVYGNCSLPSSVLVESDSGKEHVEMYVFHSSLFNKQNRYLAKELMKNDAVKLFPGCDEEYLYEVLSETTDEHFFETVKRLAAGIPIYEVTFKENGEFTIEEMGKVI